MEWATALQVLREAEQRLAQLQTERQDTQAVWQALMGQSAKRKAQSVGQSSTEQGAKSIESGLCAPCPVPCAERPCALPSKGTPLPQVMTALRRIEALDQQIELQTQVVEARTAEAEARRQAYVERQKEFKVVDELRQKAWRNYLTEVERQEQQTLDELGLIDFARGGVTSTTPG
jgi:flagellar biosynthesis chaperone FliJ